MSTNPYDSPAIVTAAAVAPGHYLYRPANLLVGFLTALLIADLACDVLVAVMSLMEATVFHELMLADDAALEEDPAAVAFLIGYACSGLLMLVAYLLTVVFFCIWVNRANKNARALGSAGMEFTPGWAVGWFFIPVANLWKPFQAVREIYRASDPQSDSLSWKNAAVPGVLGLWWGLWIAGNLLSNVEFRFALNEAPEAQMISSWLGVINGGIGVLTALAAIRVVRGIQRRQVEKAERQPANPAPAQADWRTGFSDPPRSF